jgi:hypothetical protein
MWDFWLSNGNRRAWIGETNREANVGAAAPAVQERSSLAFRQHPHQATHLVIPMGLEPLRNPGG